MDAFMYSCQPRGVHPAYLLAGDGDPLEAVLAHQVLEGQLQFDFAFGRAGGIAGAVGDGDLLQERKMPVPAVRTSSGAAEPFPLTLRLVRSCSKCMRKKRFAHFLSPHPRILKPAVI